MVTLNSNLIAKIPHNFLFVSLIAWVCCCVKRFFLKSSSSEALLSIYVRNLAYDEDEEKVSIPNDELPTGKGFADMVFWPKDYASCPALIVELKRNKSSLVAIKQIDKKQYTAIFNGYKGNVLKVGINYSIKDKKHTCKIEKFSFPRT